MTRLPEPLRKFVFPTPEERWEAGGATFRETDGLPIFDIEITHATPPKSEDYYARKHPLDRREVKIGRVLTRTFTLNDGVERVSRLWLPDTIEGTLTGQSGTAFTTSIDGYAAERAKLISARVNMPNIQHDAEHSGRKMRNVLDIIRLACTLKDGQVISLAKSAQSEAKMTEHWLDVDKIDIPPDLAAFGDSWDGINTLALPPYADLYGIQVPYIDPKALVLHEPVEPSLEGIKKVANWVRKEVIGGTAVIAALAAEGDISPLNGTVPTNPHFWLSSFTGVAPALLGGEAGRFTGWLPPNILGYANLFEKDDLCEVETWKEDLEQFPNIGVRVDPEGLHAHLLSRISQSKQRGRMHRLHNENMKHGTTYQNFDAQYIHGSYLGMPDAA